MNQPLRDETGEKAMIADQNMEALAAIEHERWAHWQNYLHSQCIELLDGTLVIPAELARRWKRQADTPYAALSEKEKDSDREQVRRYLPIIENILTTEDGAA